MLTMLVSVIIPTYNRAFIIEEAVGCVLAQTHPEIELIIIDDGSTDDTLEKLSPYKSQLTYHYQPYRGPAAARNQGIIRSSAALLAFLDSDDLWHPQKITRQLEFMNAHPQLLISQSEELWLRRSKTIQPQPRHRKSGGNLFYRSLKLCLISPSAVIMRRELIHQVGLFDESLPACEDYDFWLRVLSRFPVGYLADQLVTKRAGDWEQQSQAVEALDKYRILSLTKLLSAVSLNTEQRGWVREELERKVEIYTLGCRKRGKEEEALFYRSLIKCL